MKKIVGIYAIKNTVTNEKYVGSSRNIRLRYKIHLSQLKKGEHHSPPLQYSWAYSRVKDWKLIILEKVRVDISDDDLIKRELFWFHELRAELNAEVPTKRHTIDFRKFVRNPYAEWNIIPKTKSKKLIPNIMNGIYTFGWSEDNRPSWHSWVYGGTRNPITLSKNCP